MKKFLLSILCFAGLTTAANAEVVAFVADGATYDGTGTITPIANNADGNVLGTTYTSEACDLVFTQVNTFFSNVTGGQVRWYKSDQMTITPSNGATITSIVLKPTASKYVLGLTASTGDVVASSTDMTITWAGSTTEALTLTASEGQVRFYYAEVTYTPSTVAPSVAAPTFSVEAGTYGEKQSVELACESEGAVIYYTLDGTTPDNTSTLYEAAIELNTKTTVKAVAYVGEEASNVVSATYDFKLDCVLTWNENSPFIQASTTSPKTNFVSPLGNTGANYWVTRDGTEPSAENGTKMYPNASFAIYSAKKDTTFTMKVRAEKDGIYGETLEGTFYFAYAASLNAYKGISEMTAGNYVMSTEGTIARRLDGDYGYLPTVATTATGGFAGAFGYFEWTFEATDGGYYIKDSQGKYLWMNETFNSFNVSEEVPASAGVWTVEINADGTAKIMNVEKQKYIQYSAKYTSWGCYPDEQGTMPVLGAVYTPTITMSPAAGETVESISKITFTCPDGIAPGTKYNYCSLQGNNVTAGVTSYNQVDDNTVEFILSEPVTASGEYTFVFYKEVLTVAPNTLAQKYPAATEYITLNIQSSTPEIELVVTPENNSTQKSLQNFTFSYEEGIIKNDLFGGEAPFLGFTDPATGASSMIALTPTMATETSVTLATETAQTTEGYYTLVVPAEYFVLGGSKPNEAIMNQYVVSATNPNAVNVLSVTPEEGTVTELSNITVTTDTDLESAPDNWTITDAKGTSYKFQITNNDNDKNDSYESLNIVLSETITAEGTYTLNIPAGSVKEYLGNKAIEAQTITWTIEAAVEETDYIFDACDYEAGAEFTTLTDGIFTFLQGEGSTKTWLIDENDKKFSNGHVATKRIKPQTDKNYLTADVPAAGKLVFGVISSSSSATDRTLSVKQNDVELYGKVVCDANDKVDGVYTVHEVAVEAGLATITMAGALNFYYIEFVPAGNEEPASIEFLSVNPAEGAVESLKEIQIISDTDLGEASGLKLTDANGTEYEISSVTNNRIGDDNIYESIIVTIAEEITAAGTYTLTIPAGAVVQYITDMNIAPKVNAEKTYTWTIEAAEQPLAIVSTTVAEGAELESFSEITIEFNKPVWYNVGVSGSASLKDAEGFPVADLEAEMIDPVGNHTTLFGSSPLATKVRFYVATPVTDAGSYQIVIPAEAFSTDDMSETTAKTTIKFDIVAPALAIVSTTPAEGEEVESFSEMIVEYNMPVWDTSFGSAKVVDAEGTKVATLTCEMIDPVGNHTTLFGSTPLAYKVRMYTDTPITTDGAYSVVIAKETFALDDASQYSEKATINFTVKAAELPLALVSTDPAEGTNIVETLESILTIWNKDIDMAYDGVESWIEDAEGNKVTSVNGSYVYDENHMCIDNQLRFELSDPITQAQGVHTLVIGAGYVTDMATCKELNEEIRISFNLDINSGINGVKADAENGYVVYDLNGYRVMQTRNAADLNRLENGIYIINGTKVLLNK